MHRAAISAERHRHGAHPLLLLGHIGSKEKATGQVMDMNLHHYFVFRGSKIAFYRGTEDTVQTVAVLAG
jgi:hypothetical protein